MSTPASGRMIRWLAKVSLALLVGLLLVPCFARAECGDYVIIGSTGFRGHSQAPQQPIGPMEHDKPCSGPNCSRGGHPAAPVPVPPSTHQTEEWGHVFSLELFAGSVSQRWPAEEHRAYPVTSRLSIYHPPR
jgi:hypothetical protein